jgi:hypothetical protein
VSNLRGFTVFQRTTDLLCKIFTPKDLFRVWLGKEDAMLMLQKVDRTLLKKEESRIPLDWKLYESNVSNSSEISGMHIKSLILEIM